VAPVHAKAMPVLLTTEEQREVWLTGSTEKALKLQRPAPDGTLKIVSVGLRKDGEASARDQPRPPPSPGMG
jgi:putative SOS response-associated peptidase YedK